MRSIEKIIALFRKFPGVGPKQAERFAMHVVKSDNGEIESLCRALRELKQSVKYCRICFNLSESEVCEICSDESRSRRTICVVERPQDVQAIERTGTFNGLYHVLHGRISPLSGNDFSSLRIRELVERVSSGKEISEVIIATNPSSDGEATALYLTKILKNRVGKITRIAYGVPLGGDIDYLDEMTLSYALKGRVKI